MGSEYETYWCRVDDEWSKTNPWKFGTPVDVVELPVSWLLDDFPHFEFVAGGVLPGVKSPRELLQTWIDEFDYLYDNIGSGISMSLCILRLSAVRHECCYCKG
jgi:peptidoglycan-N-acetylglucosamine deacetylase